MTHKHFYLSPADSDSTRIVDGTNVETCHLAPLIRALDSVITYAASRGLKLRGYDSTSLARLLDLSAPAVNEIRRRVTLWHDSLVAAGNERVLETSEGFALRWAAKKMGWGAPEEFFRCVRAGDVVEIYCLSDMTQLWRNFEFLKLCSYDLATLMSMPLEQLFYRDDAIVAAIHESVSTVIAQREVMLWNVPPHTLVEKWQSHNYSFQIHPGFISPLFDDSGRIAGFASTLRAEFLGSAYRHLPNVSPLSH